jgi:hypothetical protein
MMTEVCTSLMDDVTTLELFKHVTENSELENAAAWFKLLISALALKDRQE